VEINSILLGVLLVLASALCGVGIWALLEAVKSARSARTLTDDLDARVVPLLEKADVTIDALNAELLRVDSIVSRIEEATDRFESTSRTVQDVANAPGEIVTDIADRVRRAWKRRQSESAAASDSRRAEADAEQTAEAAEPPVWPTAAEPQVQATADTPESPATEGGPTAAEATYL
jgi:cytoskeletal protein RodZ